MCRNFPLFFSPSICWLVDMSFSKSNYLHRGNYSAPSWDSWNTKIQINNNRNKRHKSLNCITYFGLPYDHGIDYRDQPLKETRNFTGIFLSFNASSKVFKTYFRIKLKTSWFNMTSIPLTPSNQILLRGVTILFFISII